MFSDFTFSLSLFWAYIKAPSVAEVSLIKQVTKFPYFLSSFLPIRIKENYET